MYTFHVLREKMDRQAGGKKETDVLQFQHKVTVAWPQNVDERFHFLIYFFCFILRGVGFFFFSPFKRRSSSSFFQAAIQTAFHHHHQPVERKGGGKLIHQQDPCMAGRPLQSARTLFSLSLLPTGEMMDKDDECVGWEWMGRTCTAHRRVGKEGDYYEMKSARHAIASSVRLVVMAAMRGSPARVIVARRCYSNTRPLLRGQLSRSIRKFERREKKKKALRLLASIFPCVYKLIPQFRDLYHMCVYLVEPIPHSDAYRNRRGGKRILFLFVFFLSVFPDQRPIHLFNWRALLFSETLFDHQTLLGVARN
jgi:hypothetical protein